VKEKKEVIVKATVKKTKGKRKVSLYVIVTFILIAASRLTLPTTTFLLHIYDPPTTYKDVTVKTTEKAEVSGAAEQVFNLHATYHPCTILTTHSPLSLITHPPLSTANSHLLSGCRGPGG
jgi:hypothetical protein